MRDTSQAAYYQHSMSGAMLSQRLFVLQFLRENGPRTRAQLSEATGIPINAICGRCSELIKQELATDSRKVKTASGRWAYLVEAA